MTTTKPTTEEPARKKVYLKTVRVREKNALLLGGIGASSARGREEEKCRMRDGDGGFRM